jgi:DNA-binding XRE family transcriptional regulator
MNIQTLEIEGKSFVLVEKSYFERIRNRAGMGVELEDDLPPLPPADKDGSRPALQYMRAVLARRIITGRREAGLSQQALADRAGVRQETISRIETGKHTATPAIIGRIEKALERKRAT